MAHCNEDNSCDSGMGNEGSVSDRFIGRDCGALFRSSCHGTIVADTPDAPAGAGEFFTERQEEHDEWAKENETKKDWFKRKTYGAKNWLTTITHRPEELGARQRIKQAKAEHKEAKKEHWAAKEAKYEAQSEHYNFSALAGKFKGRVFEILLFFILGLVAALNPWFPMTWVGVSLIIIALFYTPFHHSLAMRAIIKFVVIILITFQFTIEYRMYFIALGFLWMAYFSMPTSYRHEDETQYEGSEVNRIKSKNLGNAFSAWMRVIVGIFLSIVIYAAFGGAPEIAGIAIMAAAFFITPPHKVTDSGAGISIQFTKDGKVYGPHIAERISTIIFIILMLVAVFLGFTLGAWGSSGTLGWVMAGFWLIGLFAGIFAQSAGRPHVGVGLIVIGLFIFSMQFTGTVGTELFGAYWPTVEHYGSMITDPIFGMVEKSRESVSDAYLIITCPSCYEQKKLEEERAKAAKLDTKYGGGTTKSIELKDFNAVNYGTARPTIDPALPFVGTIRLENEGEFTADKVYISLNTPLIKDPKKVGLAYNTSPYCSFSDPTGESCTYTLLEKDNCMFTSCPGLDETVSLPASFCSWTEFPTVPEEVKFTTFKCGDQTLEPPYSMWNGDINTKYAVRSCSCHSRDDPKASPEYTYGSCNYVDSAEEMNKYDGCYLNTHILTYQYGNYYLTLDMDYSFTYDVDAQANIHIMDEDLFLHKLTNKEITVKQLESKYTGGPVVLTIWIQSQPLRSGEESFVTISVLNDGDGKIAYAQDKDAGSLEKIAEKSELMIYFPKEIVEQGTIPTVLNNIGLSKPDTTNIVEDNYVLVSTLEKSLKKGEFARMTLSFKTALPAGVDEKTNLITAAFDYTYVNNKKLEFPIIKVPIQ